MTPKEIHALTWVVACMDELHSKTRNLSTTNEDHWKAAKVMLRQARAALVRARKECNDRKRCKEYGATVLQKAPLPECMKS